MGLSRECCVMRNSSERRKARSSNFHLCGACTIAVIFSDWLGVILTTVPLAFCETRKNVHLFMRPALRHVSTNRKSVT